MVWRGGLKSNDNDRYDIRMVVLALYIVAIGFFHGHLMNRVPL